MALTDATSFVHGTGQNALSPITYNGVVWGDSLCAAGSQYSNLEIDSSRVAGLVGGIFQFPSVIEMGYAFPPGQLGSSGISYGLHFMVQQPFNLLTSITIEVCTSATTNAPNTNPIAARAFSLAQLGIGGVHYFIPVSPGSMLQYTRFWASLNGTAPTTGTVIAFFSPPIGGEQ